MTTVENEKKMETTKNEEFDIVLKMNFSTYSPAATALCVYLILYYKF